MNAAAQHYQARVRLEKPYLSQKASRIAKKMG